MHEGSNPSKTGNIAWRWMSGSLLPNSQKETLVQGAKWGRRKGIHNKVRVWGCVQDIQAALKGFGLSPAVAKSLQSCLTLCDPIDGGPPGSPIPGILQARTLKWVAISFSKNSNSLLKQYHHLESGAHLCSVCLRRIKDAPIPWSPTQKEVALK